MNCWTCRSSPSQVLLSGPLLSQLPMHVIQMAPRPATIRASFRSSSLHLPPGIALVYELVQFVIQSESLGNQLSIGWKPRFCCLPATKGITMPLVGPYIKSHHHHGPAPAFHLEMPMDTLCRVDVRPIARPEASEEQHLFRQGWSQQELPLIFIPLGLQEVKSTSRSKR